MFQGQLEWADDNQPAAIWLKIPFERRAGSKCFMFHVLEHKIEYEPHYTLYGFMGKLDCLVLVTSY